MKVDSYKYTEAPDERWAIDSSALLSHKKDTLCLLSKAYYLYRGKHFIFDSATEKSLPGRPQDKKGSMNPTLKTATAVSWIIPVESQGHKSKRFP